MFPKPMVKIPVITSRTMEMVSQINANILHKSLRNVA